MMLYVASTPIGNLDDITLRAIDILKSVDIIACEDTRHTRILLEKYGILERCHNDLDVCHSDPPRRQAGRHHVSCEQKNPLKNSHTTGNTEHHKEEKGSLDSSLHEVARDDRVEGAPRLVSYHQHSGESKTTQIIEWLKKDKDIAIVTDAGTPGISDPGTKLIAEAIKNNIQVAPIPGPSAFVAALSVSGFGTKEFVFTGFLPHKKGRQTKLNKIAEEKRTVVMYESVHRIKKLLGELNETIPEREICVCRELTKKFEEIYRGTASEVEGKVKEKGEFAVVIEGKK